MPSLVLTMRLERPFTLMFSRSLGFKNLRPKFLYLLHASAWQWHKVGTISSFSSPHSRQTYRCVGPRLNVWAVRVMWSVSSSTASFCLFIARSAFVLLGRCLQIEVLDWWQPWQVFHLFRCCCLKWLLMTSFPTTKGCQQFGHKGLH